MCSKNFLLVVFSIMVVPQAFAERGLTPVTRESCISFPKVISADQMKLDVHYTKHTYCSERDAQGICDEWDEYLDFNYYYVAKKIIDYYSADGKLITTKNENSKVKLTATGHSREAGVSNLVKEIETTIYTDSEPVCADSFYK